MVPPQEHQDERSESPDPGSYTRNTYDAAPVENEWNGTEDNDMNYEPPDEEDEELEYFESTEDADGDFQGTSVIKWTPWDSIRSKKSQSMLNRHRCR